MEKVEITGLFQVSYIINSTQKNGYQGGDFKIKILNCESAWMLSCYYQATLFINFVY